MQKTTLKTPSEQNSRVSVANSFNKQLTKIKGVLTSSVRPKPSSDVPYMAFFRANYTDAYLHSLSDCRDSKCKSCEIPVVFRLKDFGCDESHFLRKNHCWVEPNLSKGNKVILEGKFSESKDSNRPSFTAYSYQILKDYE